MQSETERWHQLYLALFNGSLPSWLQVMSLAWNLQEFPSQHVGDPTCFQEVT